MSSRATFASTVGSHSDPAVAREINIAGSTRRRATFADTKNMRFRARVCVKKSFLVLEIVFTRKRVDSRGTRLLRVLFECVDVCAKEMVSVTDEFVERT